MSILHHKKIVDSSGETYDLRPRMLDCYREMSLRSRIGSVHFRTQIARVLSCVLLVGIVYSATFDVVHSHGTASSSLIVSHNFHGQVGVVSDVPLRGRTDGQECLICALHRQFAASVVDTPFFLAESDALTTTLAPTASFLQSETFSFSPIAGHSGRAPPHAKA